MEELDKKFIQYLTKQVSHILLLYFYIQGIVTPETLSNIIQIVRRKRLKKNYQEILIEYLNNINNSDSKINFVTKEIKIAFFSCMNDLVLNKNDELKYLILMIEEKNKKNKKENYFNIWKNNKIAQKDKNDINNNEDESNIIVPFDDYIESLREQKENDNQKDENNQECFIIEENNKISQTQNNQINEKNELTISNNEQYKNNEINENNKKNINENCNNENINNDNKRNNEEIKKINLKEKMEDDDDEEEEGEKALIIDYDDETNSVQPGNKSENSEKNNFSLMHNDDDKEKIKENINLNFENNNKNRFLKEKSIKIENDFHINNTNNKNIINNNNEINDIDKEEKKIIYNKLKINNEENKNKKHLNNYFNNKSEKISKKIIMSVNNSDIIEKGGKSFSEIEEENRLNYLLSSKNNINEIEAKNIINLKKTINDAIKKTNNSIQKINNYEMVINKMNLSKNNDVNNNLNNKENITKSKNNNYKMEEIDHFSFDNSNINNKDKNILNTPVNVDNINLIGDKENQNKFEKLKNKFNIQKLNIESFTNNKNIVKIEHSSSNKKNGRNNNIEKYDIIYNNEFSFAPESSSHNKEKDIYIKIKNKNKSNNDNNKIENINKNSDKEIEESNKNINELTNSNEEIINKKYFSNNNNNSNNEKNNNKVSNELINNNIFKNFNENKGRLINEEMIRNFLNNHKNERILSIYTTPNVELENNMDNNNIIPPEYKNKYLGYTLEGTNRNKNNKNKTKSNNKKNEINNSLDNNNITYNLDKDINKIKIIQNNDNDNNISGLNKICNMLDDLFYEEKIKNKNKNLNQNINEYNNKKYKNENIITKNIKTENGIQKDKIIDLSKTNSYGLDFSTFNNVNEEVSQNFNENGHINTKNNINKYNYNTQQNDNKNIQNKKINENNNYILDDNNNIISNIDYNFKQQINIYSSKQKLSFPLSTMSFNQRLEHFSNKKNLDLEKIKNNITNIEEDIYTFYPRTNKFNQNIKYGYKSKSGIKMYDNNTSKRKTKINYKRLNELYMDYKDKNARIKRLAKENDIKDGISFNPKINISHKEKNKSKGKITKIPFLNKIENI